MPFVVGLLCLKYPEAVSMQTLFSNILTYIQWKANLACWRFPFIGWDSHEEHYFSRASPIYSWWQNPGLMKKKEKKSKSVTTSHSALLLARTWSKMTEFSLYSQETRQFTWCHKLCRAQLDVIFSDVGHWLENCEMRARWFLLAPEKVKVQQQDPCWHNASAF